MKRALKRLLNLKPTTAILGSSHTIVHVILWLTDAQVLRPGTILFIFLYFTLCLTFSLRLMVTHRLDSCDHLLYRLVTRYVLVSLLLS